MPPINVAIIGYGFSAKSFHIPFITHHHATLSLHSIIQRARPTPPPPHSSLAATDHPSVRTFHTTADFYTHPSSADVSLVVVATSNISHYEYAREAVEAGKNVVVEKPFTTKSRDAVALAGLARERGVCVCVYQNRRFDSDFLTLQKVIAGGEVGRIVSLESHFDRYRPEPLREGMWKSRQVPGNGVLFDLGTHLIDQAVVLFGVPRRVFGIIRDERGVSVGEGGGKWGDEGFVDDYFEAVLFYDGDHGQGFTVKLEASSMSCRERQVRFVLRGAEGGWVKYGMDVQEGQLLSGMAPGDDGFGVAVEEEEQGRLMLADGAVRRTEAGKGDYGTFYAQLVDHLCHGGSVPTSLCDAANVIKIVEFIGESNRLGRIVDVEV